jgi:hypothetical protein
VLEDGGGLDWDVARLARLGEEDEVAGSMYVACGCR